MIVSGIQAGIRSGLRRGLTTVLDDQHFPVSAAEMTALVGYTPSHIFRHQQASGASVDDVAGVSLSAQGSPTVGVTTAFLNGDRAVQMADNTGQRMQAANSTVFDEDSVSFAWLAVLNFGASKPSGLRFWLGKIGTAFYVGRLTADGFLQFVCHDGTSTFTVTTTGNFCDGLWHCIVFGVDHSGDVMRLVTDTGESLSTSVATLGSLNNSGVFVIGRSAASAPQIATYHARFTGDDAVGVLDNAASVIAGFFKGPVS